MEKKVSYGNPGVAHGSKICQYVENKVFSAIDGYNLIEKDDKVLVAYSGGKDSTALLNILNMRYSPEAVFIDLKISGYSRQNLENARSFCKDHDIKIHIYDIREEIGYSLCYLKSLLHSKGMKLNSCTVCGVLRRYILNKKARKLGGTKIATGHNLDDEAQAVMMNLLRNSLDVAARQGPSPGLMRRPEFIPRIKPLYFCRESEIAAYCRAKGFNVLYSRCPCVSESYRNQIRNILNGMDKDNPAIKQNIVDYLLSVSESLRKKYSGSEINYCRYCHEPNANDLCRACQILSLLKT